MFKCSGCGTVIESPTKPIDWLAVYGPDYVEYFCADCRAMKHLLLDAGCDGVDMVNKPPHYTTGDIECIDAIHASMSDDEFAGYLKGNAMKYLWRYNHKGKPIEDLGKCLWYVEKLKNFTKERSS